MWMRMLVYLPSILVHLFHDITSANELTLNIDLWNRRPIGVVLDCLSEVIISKDIHVLVLLDSVCVEKGDHVLGESAAGHLACPFHEKADIVLLNPSGDMFSELV